MQPGPEDLGMLYTMFIIFFIVSAFTLGFSNYVLKAEKKHEEAADSHAHH